jgi:hypothetical protein
MRLWWFSIPIRIRVQFYSECSSEFYSECSSGCHIHDDEYFDIIKTKLLEYRGCLIRDNGKLFIDFEDEMYYNWFLLRYS